MCPSSYNLFPFPPLSQNEEHLPFPLAPKICKKNPSELPIGSSRQCTYLGKVKPLTPAWPILVILSRMRPSSCVIFVQLFGMLWIFIGILVLLNLFTEAKNWYTIKFCLQCVCTLSLVRCFTTTCKQTRTSPPNSDHLGTAGSVLWVCLFVCKDVLDLESALTIIQLSHFTRSENGFQSTRRRWGEGGITLVMLG